jgi:glyoxylase-like metal-dependent hydrolase (beta-lactamase superfamily II)
MSTPATPDGLGVNVFTAPGKSVVGERPRPFGPPLGWDPITSTLIYGEYDAVLVDPLTTVAEATALAHWVALHHRNLTTIYITHGHFDHFFGLSVLLDHFPDAKAIATPESIELINKTSPELAHFAQTLFPGQFPAKIIAPEAYADDTFVLEGHELRIIKQGRTDTIDSTSLYVPSIDLVVGGDVLYNQCHMFVGDTTAESRENWIAALDRLAALKPKIAVAGHKKTGAPDTPGAIEGSQNYLRDFGRLQESTNSDEELFDEMTKLYPDWVSHQSWLMFGLPVATIPEF